MLFVLCVRNVYVIVVVCNVVCVIAVLCYVVGVCNCRCVSGFVFGFGGSLPVAMLAFH